MFLTSHDPTHSCSIKGITTFNLFSEENQWILWTLVSSKEGRTTSKRAGLPKGTFLKVIGGMAQAFQSMCEVFRVHVIKEQHVRFARQDGIHNLLEYFFGHDRVIKDQVSRDRFRTRGRESWNWVVGDVLVLPVMVGCWVCRGGLWFSRNGLGWPYDRLPCAKPYKICATIRLPGEPSLRQHPQRGLATICVLIWLIHPLVDSESPLE